MEAQRRGDWRIRIAAFRVLKTEEGKGGAAFGLKEAPYEVENGWANRSSGSQGRAVLM
jgi:hypothetical protein